MDSPVVKGEQLHANALWLWKKMTPRGKTGDETAQLSAMEMATDVYADIPLRRLRRIWVKDRRCLGLGVRPTQTRRLNVLGWGYEHRSGWLERILRPDIIMTSATTDAARVMQKLPSRLTGKDAVCTAAPIRSSSLPRMPWLDM